jgi:glycosyltransferase involved in cell wall biosynthesis
MPTKPLGIVIPTHNRSGALLECLAHLEAQTFHDFEVVVVDDGSSDTTARTMEEYQRKTPLNVRYVQQSNHGPATARNLGISLLQAPICLLLGDDMFASPTLVQRHLQMHQENPDVKVAAIGLVRWSTSGQEVTPFMRWLDEANVQFSYPQLLAGAKPNWGHFYSSNLSVKTELLRRFTFNEDFRHAAMEDMELAYRIEKRFGLDLKFLPDAVANHFHPTTFRQACNRMVRVGSAYGLYYELWPEQRPPQQRGRRQAIVKTIAGNPHLLGVTAATVNLITKAICPNPFMLFILHCYFEVGLQGRIPLGAKLSPAAIEANPKF